MAPNDMATSYAVDLVFCIDCTGSMKPYLQSVKETAEEFHDLLIQKMLDKDKEVAKLRIKVVAYRDFGHDGARAMKETGFFGLPEDLPAYTAFVEDLEPSGGGDEPESALEALALAIGSHWNQSTEHRTRHVIVMCTDASAHRLGTYAMPGRPDLPKNLDELHDMWGIGQDSLMDHRAKRLVLFAPDMYPWNTIGEEWDQVIWFPAKAKQGLKESEQTEILEIIAGSI